MCPQSGDNFASATLPSGSYPFSTLARFELDDGSMHAALITTQLSPSESTVLASGLTKLLAPLAFPMQAAQPSHLFPHQTSPHYLRFYLKIPPPSAEQLRQLHSSFLNLSQLKLPPT